MAKIIRLKRSDNVELFLYEVIGMAEEGEIDNVMIAAKLKSGEVVTGFYGLDVGDRQELISHQQIDVTREVVEQLLNDKFE